MTMSQDPLSVAKRGVELALQVGADAADAYVVYDSRQRLSVRDGEIENLNRAVSRGLGLRVVADRRTALVHTTDLSNYAIVKLATAGLEMARALPAAPEPVVLGAPQAIEPYPYPDPDLQGETLAEKKARLVRIERALRAVGGVTRTGSVNWSERDGEIGQANSRGLSLYAPFCRVEIGVEAIAEREGDSVSGGFYAEVPARRALPSPDEIGELAGRRAAEMLGARTVPSAKVPVIFTPRTGWALLACLADALRGDNVVQGRSYLAERMGRMVASPMVTIRDNPHLTRGVGRCLFDAEGSPTRDLALVEAGRLQAYLCDLSTGAKLGVPQGGNATRDSYDSSPDIGTTNLYLEPGSEAPEEIVKATARGLLVTSLSGWWVGNSSVTDSFSSAAMGVWIENGERAHPVRGISIGGALLEMLGGIDRVGNDLEFLGGTSTPTFRVAEMAISGT
jgi:PmbA protein